MKEEIINLLRKENLGNLTQEEKELMDELFDHSEVDDVNGIIDCRYYINGRFWVEVYGKEVEDTIDETIIEIDFSKKNYFRFFELGNPMPADLDDILKVEELLKEIEDLEIELKIKLEYLYNDDKQKVVAHQDYIIEKMPKGFFDEHGEINLEYESAMGFDYEYILDTYKDILEEEIILIEEEIYESEN